MGTHLSDAEVRRRLNLRGFTLVGPYLGDARGKQTVKCSASHEYLANLGHLMYGRRGCPFCSAKERWISREDAQQRLDSRNIRIVGDWTNGMTETTFECGEGHHWSTTAFPVLSGNGCPVCYNLRKSLTDDEVRQTLADHDITLIDEYIDTQTRIRYQCSEGHEWATTLNKIRLGSRCPECCGFSHGFSVDKPAHAYILRFEWGLKFGVSNFLEQRLKQHRLNGEFVVVMTQFFEQGQGALDWETEIKREHKGRFATQEQCPDGWTETLSLDKEQIIVESLSRVSSVLKVVKEGGFTSYEQADELAT